MVSPMSTPFPAARPTPTAEGPSKVPEVVTGWFWIAKILTTAMGEATSDYLVHRISPYVAVLLGAVGLVLALTLQLRARRYSAPVYWFAVVMVAIAGTMGADVLHVEFGVPYVASTVLYAVAMVAVFAAWKRTEGTLSIHAVDTRRRELFYWAAVLSTFAMGTALGDLTAYTAHLGFFSAGLLFMAVFSVPAVAYRLRLLSAVPAFWFAYIVTRPLGASFADWMGVPRALGGLDWGRGTVSLALAALIVALVAFIASSGVDLGSRRTAVHKVVA